MDFNYPEIWSFSLPYNNYQITSLVNEKNVPFVEWKYVFLFVFSKQKQAEKKWQKLRDGNCAEV